MAPIQSLPERIRSHRLAASFVLLGTLSAGVIAGSVLTGTVHGAMQQKTDTSDAAPLRVPPATNQPNQFTQIAKQVGPAVVNINTESLPKQSTAPKGRRGLTPHGGDQGDMQDFFNRFFGGTPGGGDGDDDDDQSGPGGGGERRALGSGFIVDPRGYIVTNNHVVDKADKIFVKLSTDSENDPGRPARVIGVDKETDLAVIKIDATSNLPTVKLGNSEGAQVGDWVLAIGSPFSLSQTVTAGIVSAKNRTEPGGGSQFQKFIQTDAAINPGNSGGPLLDMTGAVIGVNTAIYTQSMGSVGVGFAVPSNTVIGVYNMLISPEHKVVRGSIGISFQPTLSSSVSRVYGFAKGGVLVSTVTPGGPAAKGGIKPQDVITAIDGSPVKDGDDLVSNVAPRRPGSTARLTYLRDGKENTVTVTIADRNDTVVALNGSGDDDGTPGKSDAPTVSRDKFGMSVSNVPQEMLSRLKLSGGVAVTSIKPGSFADDLPLSKGDIITEVNRHATPNVSEFESTISKLKSGDDVVFVIHSPNARGAGGSSFVGGKLP
jgi:serine protease Do